MEDNKKKGLGMVLEGGGMRGLYTAGVLDELMEQASFHATGCHFTGPVALRHRLSSALPIVVLLQIVNLCKILISLYSYIPLYTRKTSPL